MAEALDLLTKGELASKVESIFIIGGSAVYGEVMMSGRYPCRLYLTRVLDHFTCDTFLPKPEEYNFHKVPNPENIPSETLRENDIDFRFEVYEKD
jgi:dihydrofolate reductase